MWNIKFYKGVDRQILMLPAKLQARMIRMLELMELHRPIQKQWGKVCLKLEQKHKRELLEVCIVT